MAKDTKGKVEGICKYVIKHRDHSKNFRADTSIYNWMENYVKNWNNNHPTKKIFPEDIGLTKKIAEELKKQYFKNRKYL